MRRFLKTFAFGITTQRRACPCSLEKWLCFAIVPVLWALIAATNLAAQQQRLSEYQVKATYLYNFGRFVRWPKTFASGKDDSFGVCVLGQDHFGPALDSTFAGETLAGKPVVIRRISKPQDAAGCRILFISSSEEVHLQAILSVIDDAGTLTVSDMRDFTQRGGMIQFVLESNRIRFEINLASAERSRLVLSSELLKVAFTVRRNAPPGE
ncbi:MAG: YfiR family protein [Candidatus Acidiferrales bacterium]